MEERKLSAQFASETEQLLLATGDWAPSIDELKRADPDTKRFYVIEAALHLNAGKILPASLAIFVGDLLLDYVSRGIIRKAAKALVNGEKPDPVIAHWIANWLLQHPRFRGRPPTERRKDMRVAATFYLHLRSGDKKPDRAAVRLVAEQLGCSEDFVRKCRNKYSPMASYECDDLIHLLAATKRNAPQFARRLDAREFLHQLLTSGPRPTREIERRALLAGYSKRTLARAKMALGILAARSGKGWVWRLPSRLPTG